MWTIRKILDIFVANINQMYHICWAFCGVYWLDRGDTDIVGSDPTQATDDIRVSSMSLLTCVGKDLHMADTPSNDFCQVYKTEWVSERNCALLTGTAWAVQRAAYAMVYPRCDSRHRQRVKSGSGAHPVSYSRRTASSFHVGKAAVTWGRLTVTGAEVNEWFSIFLEGLIKATKP